MPDDDSLIVAMFKEIAVIQGKRTPEGAWIDASPWHAQQALETAMRIVENARTASGAKAGVTFETTRKG
jgi:hypothetical protein